jgi:hypothetical protein
VLVGWLAACFTALPLGLVAFAMILRLPRNMSALAINKFVVIASISAVLFALGLALVAECLGARRAGLYVCAGAGAVAVGVLEMLSFIPEDPPLRPAIYTVLQGVRRLEAELTFLALAAPIGALAGYVYWRIAVRTREG